MGSASPGCEWEPRVGLGSTAGPAETLDRGQGQRGEESSVHTTPLWGNRPLPRLSLSQDEPRLFPHETYEVSRPPSTHAPEAPFPFHTPGLPAGSSGCPGLTPEVLITPSVNSPGGRGVSVGEGPRKEVQGSCFQGDSDSRAPLPNCLAQERGWGRHTAVSKASPCRRPARVSSSGLSRAAALAQPSAHHTGQPRLRPRAGRLQPNPSQGVSPRQGPAGPAAREGHGSAEEPLLSLGRSWVQARQHLLLKRPGRRGWARSRPLQESPLLLPTKEPPRCCWASSARARQGRGGERAGQGRRVQPQRTGGRGGETPAWPLAASAGWGLLATLREEPNHPPPTRPLWESGMLLVPLPAPATEVEKAPGQHPAGEEMPAEGMRRRPGRKEASSRLPRNKTGKA